jgi:hypothetical protein
MRLCGAAVRTTAQRLERYGPGDFTVQLTFLRAQTLCANAVAAARIDFELSLQLSPLTTVFQGASHGAIRTIIDIQWFPHAI